MSDESTPTIAQLAERYGLTSRTLSRYRKEGVDIHDPHAVAVHASQKGRSRDTMTAPVMAHLADEPAEQPKKKCGAPKGIQRGLKAAEKLGKTVGAVLDKNHPGNVEARRRQAEAELKERQAEKEAFAVRKEELLVARLEASLIPIETVREIAVQVVAAAKAVGMRMLGDLPPRIEGMPAAKIQKEMAAEFRKMWVELSEWKYDLDEGDALELGPGDPDKVNPAKIPKRKRASRKRAKKKTAAKKQTKTRKGQAK